jgi:hypothetical protein
MKLCYFFIYLLLIEATIAGYGDESGGLPTWGERVAHALINAARSCTFFRSNCEFTITAPQQYIAKYTTTYSPSMSGILTSSYYSAKTPLYMANNLIKVIKSNARIYEYVRRQHTTTLHFWPLTHLATVFHVLIHLMLLSE